MIADFPAFVFFLPLAALLTVLTTTSLGLLLRSSEPQSATIVESC